MNDSKFLQTVTQTGAFQWCNLCQEKLVKLMLFVRLSLEPLN